MGVCPSLVGKETIEPKLSSEIKSKTFYSLDLESRSHILDSSSKIWKAEQLKSSANLGIELQNWEHVSSPSSTLTALSELYLRGGWE